MVLLSGVVVDLGLLCYENLHAIFMKKLNMQGTSDDNGDMSTS